MPDRVLLTGASGYVASQMLPTLREEYEMVLLDVRDTDRNGDRVEGVQTVDLIDPDRTRYAHHFEGVDAVIHLGHRGRGGDPLDHFFTEKNNVEMVYNVSCAPPTTRESPAWRLPAPTTPRTGTSTR